MESKSLKNALSIIDCQPHYQAENYSWALQTSNVNLTKRERDKYGTNAAWDRNFNSSLRNQHEGPPLLDAHKPYNFKLCSHHVGEYNLELCLHFSFYFRQMNFYRACYLCNQASFLSLPSSFAVNNAKIARDINKLKPKRNPCCNKWPQYIDFDEYSLLLPMLAWSSVSSLAFDD